MDETQFKKAFNDGYLLGRHAPNLIDAIKTITGPSNDYLNALQMGAKQYDLDKERERNINSPDKQTIDRNKEKDDLERDKD